METRIEGNGVEKKNFILISGYNEYLQHLGTWEKNKP